MKPLLECKNVTKKIGNFTLSNIHFALEPGYILGVVGRNGAGKSTLLRILLGSYLLTNPYDNDYVKTVDVINMAKSKGDVLIGETSVKMEPGAYKEQIAFVLNDSPFDMRLSALDNGTLYGGYYKTFQRDVYKSWLFKFEVPLRIPLCKLSKGQQIKQQLAFALSYEAKLYIFDEPAGNLDVAFRKTFYKQMRGITEDGTKSVVYVSHFVEEMEEFADYLLWLRKGQQLYFGSIEQLREEFQLVEETSYSEQLKSHIVGIRQNCNHQEMLLKIRRSELPEKLRAVSRYATLKEILYYVEKEKGI